MEEIIDVRKPLPNIGRLHCGTSLGTGILLKDGLVMTALHVVAGFDTAQFELGGRMYDARVVERVECAHAAVLYIDVPQAELPAPASLCRLPRLPVLFFTWGYRELDPDHFAFLFGDGTIEADTGNYLLQLTTRAMRPGMSGAPISIEGPAGQAVVGISRGRYLPDDVRDQEDLAFAHAVEALPAGLIERLGGIRDIIVNPAIVGEQEHLVRMVRALRSMVHTAAYVRAAAAGGLIVLAGLCVHPNLLSLSDVLPVVLLLSIAGIAAHLLCIASDHHATELESAAASLPCAEGNTARQHALLNLLAGGGR